MQKCHGNNRKHDVQKKPEKAIQNLKKKDIQVLPLADTLQCNVVW